MNPSDNTSLIPFPDLDDALMEVGQLANQYAARGVFADYLSRKADSTIRRQAADLMRFVEFLRQLGEEANRPLGGSLGAFAQAVSTFPDRPEPDAIAWQGVSWGLVEGFRNWMVGQGDAVAGVNARLSTVKTYAKQAFKAGS